jgi:hypothetical protein
VHGEVFSAEVLVEPLNVSFAQLRPQPREEGTPVGPFEFFKDVALGNVTPGGGFGASGVGDFLSRHDHAQPLHNRSDREDILLNPLRVRAAALKGVEEQHRGLGALLESIEEGG